jgi:hypothetical protein
MRESRVQGQLQCITPMVRGYVAGNPLGRLNYRRLVAKPSPIEARSGSGNHGTADQPPVRSRL